MQTARPRDDEVQSLAALHTLGVLDSAPEAEFDALVQAASLVCGAPIALISLVDAERQWFKANIGLPGVSETPRALAFCAHAVLGDGLLEVPDAALDSRFADNPLVAGAPGIRFYAGMPLCMQDGSHVGTLCVIDRQPRMLTATQREILSHLAMAAVRALEVRRQARSVASSERHFRALSEAAPLGVFATDASGACTYVNDRWQRIFGLGQSQALGDGWTRRILPEDEKKVFSEWQRNAKQRQDTDLEFRVLHADGSIHHVRAVSRAVIGADGKLSGHVGSVEDIDAQVQAGRATAELLDAVRSQFIVAISDTRGRYIEVNDAYCAISLYSRAELLKQDDSLEDAGHHPDEFFAEMRRRTGSGLSWRGEVCKRARDGSLYWVDSTIVPLRDSSGQVDRLVSISSDITALKQAERLRLRAVELEAENRLLQEANGLKSLFLSHMSHEMKTPLNAVIGLADLLQGGTVSPDEPKFKAHLRQIGASGKQLLQQIDAVLDFGRAEAGRIEFKAVGVRLPELLDEVIALQRVAAQLKQVEISTEVEAAVVELQLDPLRLAQVLSCYLSNAIKFVARQGQVSIRAFAAPGDTVRIEVEDNGIGIAPADQPRLFREFQQLSTGHTKTYPGTGMGLALVRKLVEAQGGTVGVRSTLGSGSVFHLTLPRWP